MAKNLPSIFLITRLNQGSRRESRRTLKAVMDFDAMIRTVNDLLSTELPETFNSSWISKRTPSGYRYILKNVRTDFGTVDWDRVTRALEWKFQQRWVPRCRARSRGPYRNNGEVKTFLEKYRSTLYIFVSPQNRSERHIADIISVALVRLAQCGSKLAKQELMKLLAFTIDDWINDDSTGFRGQPDSMVGLACLICGHNRCIGAVPEPASGEFRGAFPQPSESPDAARGRKRMDKELPTFSKTTFFFILLFCLAIR